MRTLRIGLVTALAATSVCAQDGSTDLMQCAARARLVADGVYFFASDTPEDIVRIEAAYERVSVFLTASAIQGGCSVTQDELLSRLEAEMDAIMDAFLEDFSDPDAQVDPETELAGCDAMIAPELRATVMGVLERGEYPCDW